MPGAAALLAAEVLGRGWAAARVVVLAGSGGNGGGGICAARHLANRGVDVRLCLADPEHLGEVPAFQHKIFLYTPGKEIAAADLAAEPADLILDALIGYGLRGAPQGIVADLIRRANGARVPILALDLPSGVDATTGEAPGEFIRPRWTMTLALPKTGLVPEKTGVLFLADVGIPVDAYRRMGLTVLAPWGKRFWTRLTCR
jgi:NAD(P)H-hydrate epimerase